VEEAVINIYIYIYYIFILQLSYNIDVVISSNPMTSSNS
jgi:hypothetical protein